MLHFFSARISPKKQKKANWRSQLHAQRSKMDSNPLGPSEKVPFVEKYKECAICAILREKTPFWGIPRSKKRCCACSGALKILPRGPQKCKSLGAIRKKRLFCRKSLILSIRLKFQFLEGWGGSLTKVLILVQRPQHKSTSDPVGAPKNNQFRAIFFNLAILRNATLFQGPN